LGVKRIAILGSTGSIGQSALAVVAAHPDRLRVVGLAAGENAELLGSQIARYGPVIAAMATGAAIDRLRQSGACAHVEVAETGRDGLIAVASHPDVDLVLCASSGTEALEAVLAAIEHGKTIALANKEVLVMAGAIVTQAAARHGVAPRTLSFTGAMQTLEAFQPLLEFGAAQDAASRLRLYHDLLDAIATHRVGDRPDRYEPRVKKRRRNHYGWLTKPRAEMKRRMAKGITKN